MSNVLNNGISKTPATNKSSFNMASSDEDVDGSVRVEGLAILPREESSSESASSSEAEDALLSNFKPNAKRKRKGRRSTFPDAVIDDMVDVITSNEIYKKKLLYENTKKKANSKYYADILKILVERA